MKETIFVLIHGAWHSANCWNKVIPKLKEQGHNAFSIDFSAKASDAKYDFDDYVTENYQILNKLNKPMILVGHSMGAAIANKLYTQIRKKVKALIYIAGSLPKNGESIDDVFSKSTKKTLLQQNFIISKDAAYITINPDAVKEIFYNDCNIKDTIMYKSQLVKQSLKALQEPIFYDEKKLQQIPKFYIECLRDNAIDISAQRLMYKKFQNISAIPMDTGHSPFYSKPKELAQHLLATLN
jgi:pimeloyl-ACP methyl ester carboxylesterase